MQLSFEYDRAYFPPFPIVEMTVVATGTGQQQLVTGLIDSGSDATQIPLHILQAIGARDVDDRWGAIIMVCVVPQPFILCNYILARWFCTEWK